MKKTGKINNFAIVICLLVTICAVSVLGSAAYAQNAQLNSEDPLIFVTDQKEAWLTEAVEAYNSLSPERDIELVKFNSRRDISQAIRDGLEADLYFIELADNFRGDLSSEIWNASIDLNSQFDDSGIELVHGLEDALSYQNELHYLPFDFVLLSFVASFPVMPSSISEAELIAIQTSASLFPTFWSSHNLIEWLIPFVDKGYSDTRSRDELIEAAKNHSGTDTAENMSYDTLFWIVELGNENDFGLTGYEFTRKYNNQEYVIGLPGANTSAIYIPNCVFGIFEECDDVNAAWSFLKTLYSEEFQSRSQAIPACQDSFDSYIKRMVDTCWASDYTAGVLQNVVNNSNAAIGVKKGTEKTN